MSGEERNPTPWESADLERMTEVFVTVCEGFQRELKNSREAQERQAEQLEYLNARVENLNRLVREYTEDGGSY